MRTRAGITPRHQAEEPLHTRPARIARVKVPTSALEHMTVGTRSRRTGSSETPGVHGAEQGARPTRAIDGRADIFSIGCVMFIASRGKHPFGGGHPRDAENSARDSRASTTPARYTVELSELVKACWRRTSRPASIRGTR